MKARILDEQVRVYSSMDKTAISVATLTQGAEIEHGGMKRSAGTFWFPILLSNGQIGYIPGETKFHTITHGALMQNNVALLAEPKEGAVVQQKLVLNTKFERIKVVERDGQKWVKIRDMNGNEGYISGNTRIRVIQQRSKATGRKNILSGVMWVVAGLLILFSNSSISGGSFTILGIGALLFGAFNLVSGLVQLYTAPI